jgi:hypothetical protein
MSKVTGPLFKWFGSKWLSSKKLPAPLHGLIVEPFAGGAGYALRHWEKKVTLCEADPHISKLWQWLIAVAKEADIRDIPINVSEGTDIRTLGLSDGQQLLLKSWQRTNNVGSCWTISPWGNKPGQWTANTRARVASEFGAVSHWRFGGSDGVSYLRGNGFEATWFIDPPYQYNYGYRMASPDYEELSQLCSVLLGQVIVCEAACAKTGKLPTWLPFRSFGSRITSRRKKENHHHSSELLWTVEWQGYP